jgi:hypothetical protein
MTAAAALESLFNEDLYQLPSRVLIILAEPWEEVSEESRTLISKILSSVRLSLPVVHIITRADFSVEDVAAFAPTRIISFGSAFKSAHKPYENTVVGNTSVIVADRLAQLDDAKKKSLWQALRVMFGI